MSEQEKTLDDFTRSSSTEDSDSTEHPRFENLPSEWRVSEIQEIAEVVGGSTPSTDSDEYWDGGIPWATPTDITNLSGNRIETTADTLTEEGLNSASTHLLPPYSVLMTSRATIGECAVNTVEMATNQGFKSLVPGDDIETWYLHYRMIKSAPFLESLGAGSTFDEVSKSVVKAVDIPVPPLDEQRKIATVLYTIDEAIQKTEEIIKNLSHTKQGFKQDIFSDGYYDHDEYKESNLGTIPREWEVKLASELCEDITVGIVTGATDHYVDADRGVPFIRSQDVNENHIQRTELKYISREFHEQQSSSELHEGDVVTVRTGQPGTSCVVPSDLEGSNCFSLIISRPKSWANERYYSYYINSPSALDFIDSWKAGGVQDNFNVGVMKRLPVPIPSEQEQNRIVEALDDINDQLAHEQQYISHIRHLKQGLMQDLLSGEVQTTDADIEVLDEVRQHG